ncbi:MAG TPA: hypothetical protein VGL77_20505 [Armatimonadota bacterium]|jgi:TolA-binding protein
MRRMLILLTVLIGGARLAGAQPTPQDMLWQSGVAAVQAGDWYEAAHIWNSIIGLKEWKLRQTREEAILQLLQAKQRLCCTAEARGIALDLLAAHPADTYTVRILVPLTTIAAAAGQPDQVEGAVRLALDDPIRPPEIMAQYLTEVVKVEQPRLVLQALLRYLAVHPAHPLYLPMRLAAAQLAAAAGEHPAALNAARELLADAAGTPVEAGTAALVAAEEAALGHYRQAGEVVWALMPYYPTDTTSQVAALTYFRQSGNLQRTADVAMVLAKTTVPRQTVETLFWLGEVALAQGDNDHAKQWLSALNDAVPEHPLAAKARRLLKSLTAPSRAVVTQ